MCVCVFVCMCVCVRLGKFRDEKRVREGILSEISLKISFEGQLGVDEVKERELLCTA